MSGKFAIKVDGREIDHADTMAQARTARSAIIYGGIGTESNTTIERRPKVQQQPEETTVPTTGITIELDDNTKAFYAGVAAAMRVQKALSEVTPAPDFDTRVRWFWLRVGVAMARQYTDEQTELTELFISGANTRAPQHGDVVHLSISQRALDHYGEDTDEDTIRDGLRALLESAAQRIQDGVVEGDIWNADNAAVGKFTTNIWG